MKTLTCRLLLSTVAVAAVLSAIPAPAWGWGDEGHRIIMRMAIDLMPPGDRAPLLARENLARLEESMFALDAIVDAGGLGAKEEKVRHFVNIEDVVAEGADFESFLIAMRGAPSSVGEVVKRIRECVYRLRVASKLGDRAEWLRWAGLLAHYVGDAHQPLHTTHNFDGRQTGNLCGMPGRDDDNVHSRLEWGLLKRYAAKVENRARDLTAAYVGSRSSIARERELFERDPHAYVCSFIWGTHGHVATVLAADGDCLGKSRKQARQRLRSGKYYRCMYEKTGELTAGQLARAAIALATLWHACSVEMPMQTSLRPER